MKKLLIAGFAIFLVACGNNSRKSAPVDEIAEIAATEPIEEATETVVDTVAVRNKVVEELKSWGARDASFDDDGYLVYAVSPSDISASANEVARQMYLLFMETPTLKGVRVVNYLDGSELGSYPETPYDNE